MGIFRRDDSGRDIGEDIDRAKEQAAQERDINTAHTALGCGHGSKTPGKPSGPASPTASTPQKRGWLR
ncbi:hypothetical protein [Streptomyces sp. CAU 1734]|uniref:hypothetical protein n=1 Tax=Streptomyces sp. CAU 1734 TaxID=3140360 RepID=UPI0032619F1E